jgi:hypothetical protein
LPLQRPENRGRYPLSAGYGVENPSPVVSADGHFADQCAALIEDAICQCKILFREHAVDPSGEDRDRTGQETVLVRRRIDASCEAGNDGETFVAAIGRKLRGEPHSVDGGVAGSDDCDGALNQYSAGAAHGDDRRRRIDSP